MRRIFQLKHAYLRELDVGLSKRDMVDYEFRFGRLKAIIEILKFDYNFFTGSLYSNYRGLILGDGTVKGVGE